MKRHLRKASFAMAGLAVLSLTVAGIAKQIKQFKGTTTGTATVTEVAENVFNSKIVATGQASHVGQIRVVLTSTSILEGNILKPDPGSSRFRITATNGDTIFGTFTWPPTDVGQQNSATLISSFTITGGTGRFAGVGGQGRYTSTISPSTGETTTSFSGTLS